MIWIILLAAWVVFIVLNILLLKYGFKEEDKPIPNIIIAISFVPIANILLSTILIGVLIAEKMELPIQKFVNWINK